MNSSDTIRIFAAHEAGRAAARLRKAGHTPREDDDGNPYHHGAFQWADACGFNLSRAERTCFAEAFIAELKEVSK